MFTHNKLLPRAIYSVKEHWKLWQPLDLDALLHVFSLGNIKYWRQLQNTNTNNGHKYQNIPDLDLILSLNSSLAPPPATSPGDAIAAQLIQC